MWLSYKASACILSFSMQHRAEATLPLARFSRINRYVVGVTGPQVLDQAVYDLLWHLRSTRSIQKDGQAAFTRAVERREELPQLRMLP